MRGIIGLRRGLAVFGVLALCAAAPAQATIEVTPGVLVAGGEAEVEYTNPQLAGEEVTVVVTGGYPAVPEAIPVKLDACGKGTARWRVPLLWAVATFAAPETDELMLPILSPADSIL